MRNRWTAKSRFSRIVRAVHEKDGRGYEISEYGIQFLWERFCDYDRCFTDSEIESWYCKLLEINDWGKKRLNLKRILTTYSSD